MITTKNKKDTKDNLAIFNNIVNQVIQYELPREYDYLKITLTRPNGAIITTIAHDLVRKTLWTTQDKNILKLSDSLGWTVAHSLAEKSDQNGWTSVDPEILNLNFYYFTVEHLLEGAAVLMSIEERDLIHKHSGFIRAMKNFMKNRLNIVYDKKTNLKLAQIAEQRGLTKQHIEDLNFPYISMDARTHEIISQWRQYEK